MSRPVDPRELLLGTIGLALLRRRHDGPPGEAARRLAEAASVLADPGAPVEAVAEAGSRAGYGAWAATYDEGDNPVVALEAPAVWGRLAATAPGLALDAACGTGRHSRRLGELGHRVVGVDLSPAMLARARDRAPGAALVEGEVGALPLGDGAFDLVVCGLALAHVADLAGAVAELARVLRPGGRLVVSALHPVQVELGGHASFVDAGGRRRFVREHAHWPADWLAAFAAAGLEVTGCDEPRLGPEHAPARRRLHERLPEATEAAFVGLPAVLVWEAAKRPGPPAG